MFITGATYVPNEACILELQAKLSTSPEILERVAELIVTVRALIPEMDDMAAQQAGWSAADQAELKTLLFAKPVITPLGPGVRVSWGPGHGFHWALYVEMGIVRVDGSEIQAKAPFRRGVEAWCAANGYTYIPRLDHGEVAE